MKQLHRKVLALALCLAVQLPVPAPAKPADKQMDPGKHFVPRNVHLKAVYDSMEAFRSDLALARLARLRVTLAKSGMNTASSKTQMARYLLLAGEAFQFDENLIAAREVYYLANKLCPDDPIAMCSLANCEHDLQNYTAEEKLIARLAALENKSIPVYKTLARHANRYHRFDQVRAYLNQAIKLDINKTDANLQLFLARLFMSEGCGDKTASQLQAATERIENPYSKQLLLADALAVTSIAGDEVENHLLSAKRLRPDDPIWRVKLGNYYILHGKEEQGWQLLSEAVNCSRFSSRAHISLASYLCSAQQYDTALNVVRRLERTVPQSSSSLDTTADIYRAKGDFDQANKHYRQAIAMDPQFAKPYETLALLLLQKKRTNEAIALMNECLKAMPTFWRPRFTFASILLDAGDLKAAAEQSRIGISMLPKPEEQLNLFARHQAGRGHAIIGTLYYQEKNFIKAAQEAREFNRLKFEPELPDVLKMVAIRPGKLSFDEDAGLNDAMTRAAMADMLCETHNLTQSINEYKKAVAIMPNDTDLHCYLLHVLSEKGDWGEAARENLIVSQKLVNKIPASLRDLSGGKSTVPINK